MACTADTNSIDLTVTGGVLTADLLIDPSISNAAQITGSGLFVAGVTASSWFAASETWTYLGADSPSFTFTIAGDKTSIYYPGMRIRLTQTTVKFFIITAVSYDGGSGLTTVTLYGGTDFALVSAAITSPSYSVAKVPTGMSMDPLKWMVSLNDTTDASIVQTSGAWANPGALSFFVPIGAWELSYYASVHAVNSSSGARCTAWATLSTANNSESDRRLTSQFISGTSGTSKETAGDAHRKIFIDIAAKTQYFLNAKADGNGGSLGFDGASGGTTMLRAICAYL